MLSLYWWHGQASCKAGKNLALFLVSLSGRKIWCEQWLAEKWHTRTYKPVQQHLYFQETEIMLDNIKYHFLNASEVKTFWGTEGLSMPRPSSRLQKGDWLRRPPFPRQEGIPSADCHLQCLLGELLTRSASGELTEHISWEQRKAFNI